MNRAVKNYQVHRIYALLVCFFYAKIFIELMVRLDYLCELIHHHRPSLDSTTSRKWQFDGDEEGSIIFVLKLVPA